MTVCDLIGILESEGFDPRKYSLAGGLTDQTICIGHLSDELWSVYYAERGEKINDSLLLGEDAACREFLGRIRDVPPIYNNLLCKFNPSSPYYLDPSKYDVGEPTSIERIEISINQSIVLKTATRQRDVLLVQDVGPAPKQICIDLTCVLAENPLIEMGEHKWGEILALDIYRIDRSSWLALSLSKERPSSLFDKTFLHLRFVFNAFVAIDFVLTGYKIKMTA